MKWTKEKPTKTGWYWYQNVGFKFSYPTIVQVSYYGTKLAIDWESTYNGHYEYQVDKLKDDFWCGPIPEPEAP